MNITCGGNDLVFLWQCTTTARLQLLLIKSLIHPNLKIMSIKYITRCREILRFPDVNMAHNLIFALKWSYTYCPLKWRYKLYVLLWFSQNCWYFLGSFISPPFQLQIKGFLWYKSNEQRQGCLELEDYYSFTFSSFSCSSFFWLRDRAIARSWLFCWTISWISLNATWKKKTKAIYLKKRQVPRTLCSAYQSLRYQSIRCCCRNHLLFFKISFKRSIVTEWMMFSIGTFL